MSTVESPVTQITETAVKNASTNGADFPELLAIGSENRIVNSAMRLAKMRIAKREGVDAAKSPMRFITRERRGSRCTGLVRIHPPLCVGRSARAMVLPGPPG